jgi:hypothetical protein
MPSAVKKGDTAASDRLLGCDQKMIKLDAPESPVQKLWEKV